MAEPIIIYIDKRDRKIIDELKENGFLSLNNSSNNQIFLIAFSIGFRDNVQIPLGSKESFTRVEYLSDSEKAIIYSCAIMHYNCTSILDDKAKLFEYAQETAHYGFGVLANFISQGSLEMAQNDLISELLNKYDNIRDYAIILDQPH